MSSTRRSPDFSFLDLPRALWYFLGPERWTFLLFSAVLLAVFCYVIAPPYIVGLIANFLIRYASTGSTARPSLATLYWLVTALAVSYALVSLVRLSTKRMMGRISLRSEERRVGKEDKA